MADNRFSSCKEDHLLKAAMQIFVKQGLKREEDIDFFAFKTLFNVHLHRCFKKVIFLTRRKPVYIHHLRLLLREKET